MAVKALLYMKRAADRIGHTGKFDNPTVAHVFYDTAAMIGD